MRYAILFPTSLLFCLPFKRKTAEPDIPFAIRTCTLPKDSLHPHSTYFNLRGEVMIAGKAPVTEMKIALTNRKDTNALLRCLDNGYMIVLPTQALIDSLDACYAVSEQLNCETGFVVGRQQRISYILQGDSTEMKGRVRNKYIQYLLDTLEDMPAYDIHCHIKCLIDDKRQSNCYPSYEDRVSHADRIALNNRYFYYTQPNILLGYSVVKGDTIRTMSFYSYCDKSIATMHFEDFRKVVDHLRQGGGD